jgi:hypothetical protein
MPHGDDGESAEQNENQRNANRRRIDAKLEEQTNDEENRTTSVTAASAAPAAAPAARIRMPAARAREGIECDEQDDQSDRKLRAP